MGVQAGVVFFDGRSTEEESRSMIASLQPFATEDVATWCDAGVLLASGTCRASAADPAAHQPRRSSSGLVMTWDGRIDNGSDLRLQLGRAIAQDATDADIALAMFETKGADGLRSLVGDWSLVIWDTRRRTLHLARDYMGVRPLYCYSNAETVMWSSSLGELAMRAGRADALDERFVARFMALRLSTDVTPYKDICAVPTGSCVSFTVERTETTRRFWRLEPGVIRYRDTRAYEEQLRALWRKAVGVRLRANGTVWAELSGGLDSSSVVCMADALIREGRVAATAIQPLSHVTLQSPEGDERTFIAEVEAQIGVRSAILGVEAHEDIGADDADWASPLAPRGVQVASVRHVRRHGGHVILSGRMGDVVMGCSHDNSVAVFDDFAAGHVATALAKMRSWSRACRKPFIEIGAELGREAVRCLFANAHEQPMSDTQRAGIDLLAAALRPLADGGRAFSGSRPSVPWSMRGLTSIVLGYCDDARLQPQSDVADVIYTYPFAHRPLVEFVLSIPGEELSAPGATRSLMRRAFHGFVPARVLRRLSKGYYPPAVRRATRRRLATLPPVEQFQIVQRGWIDPARLAEAIRMQTDGAGHTGGNVQLALLLEEWLLSRDRRAPAVMPTRKEVKTNGVLIA
jgi:asparagine synthase (glutamine-hydrolysing)